MDYIMHVKYSSFRRQFFQVFHHCAPTLSPGILARREAQASVVIIKDRALQDSEDVSYNGTESSGTSGRQLKLINYQLLVLSQPEKSHHETL